jgi:hypothetical protein
VSTNPYAHLTPAQAALYDLVDSTADSRDRRDVLAATAATAGDKAAVAVAFGGPGADAEFLNGATR